MRSRYEKPTSRIALFVIAIVMVMGGEGAALSATKFKVQHFNGIFLMMPLFVAYEEGMFKRNDLDVELVDANSGTVAAAILANGSVDAIHHATSFIMGMNARNPPEQAVEVVRYFAAPIYDLVGLHEAINQCPDAAKPYPAPLNCLRGKRVGITAIGSDNYNVMLSLMREAGLKETDVQLLALGGAVELVNALRSKQVDYMLNSEPGGTQAIDVLKIGRALVDIKANPLMQNWDGESVFALSSKVAKDPEAYKGFGKAIAEAIKFMQDLQNEDRVVAAFIKHSAIDAMVVRAMLQRHRLKFNAHVDCVAIENVAKWTVQAGLVPAEKKAECSSFIWESAP